MEQLAIPLSQQAGQVAGYPAKAGIQLINYYCKADQTNRVLKNHWIPAYAGMTIMVGQFRKLIQLAQAIQKTARSENLDKRPSECF